jgi:zinc transport system ATP-binding protein
VTVSAATNTTPHACGHHHACDHGSLAQHHPRTDAICLDNVSYHYRENKSAKSTLVLRDVTLHIEQGCNLGIIGPNGAGKTTLLKIMLGLIEGYTGTVSINGLSPKEACRKGNIVGYVPQRMEVEWRFPVTVTQVVQMGLVGKTGLFRWYTAEDRAYALEMVKRVGLWDQRDRPIGALSGGQQQRAFIARALVAKPTILLMDEPLVGVDEAGQRQFAKFIHELHESLKLTVVIVSHDLQAVAAGCNRVACLRQTIHFHDSPQGLTPQVLNEVFQHEIAPIVSGLD